MTHGSNPKPVPCTTAICSDICFCFSEQPCDGSDGARGFAAKTIERHLMLSLIYENFQPEPCDVIPTFACDHGRARRLFNDQLGRLPFASDDCIRISRGRFIHSPPIGTKQFHRSLSNKSLTILSFT